MRVCNNTGACFSVSNDTVDIEHSLNEDSVMKDARLAPHFVYNEHNRRLLVESGIMTANETWEEYRRMILRTLLRPNKEVRNAIREMNSVIHQRRLSIGVHIRTGGLLANYCEGTSMIDNKTLETVPNRIDALRRRLTDKPKDVVVFVSSDSDRAIAYLKRHLHPDYRIVASSKYARGHTTSNRVPTDKVKGALLDMFVLADCDALLTTKRSGFSMIASEMSSSSVRAVIPVNRTIVNCPRKRKRVVHCCLCSTHESLQQTHNEYFINSFLL